MQRSSKVIIALTFLDEYKYCCRTMYSLGRIAEQRKATTRVESLPTVDVVVVMEIRTWLLVVWLL
jgi:hypothetical protein